MDCNKVFETMVNHAMNYVLDNKLNAAILGISGGIDSTVVAYIFNEVERRLRREGYDFGLFGFSMPTETTDKDEFRISELVGNAFTYNGRFKVLDITDEAKSIVVPYDESCTPYTNKVRIGNVKARLRMIHLYDFAKVHKGIVVGTDNYTEYLLGYSTIGGDGLFDYCPIQYLWKTEVYELAEWFLKREIDAENWGKVHALDESIKIPPQAGLGISKTDLDEIGAPNYTTVDTILDCCLNEKDFPEWIDHEVAINVANRFVNNSYKRCLPIVINREELLN